jgi:hypothetical protein
MTCGPSGRVRARWRAIPGPGRAVGPRRIAGRRPRRLAMGLGEGGRGPGVGAVVFSRGVLGAPGQEGPRAVLRPSARACHLGPSGRGDRRAVSIRRPGPGPRAVSSPAARACPLAAGRWPLRDPAPLLRPLAGGLLGAAGAGGWAWLRRVLRRRSSGWGLQLDRRAGGWRSCSGRVLARRGPVAGRRCRGSCAASGAGLAGRGAEG